MTWTPTTERLPDLETPVLTVFNGECRILERRRETPTFEETFQAFDYWDDPTNDGQEVDDYEVTHWKALPDLPGAEPIAPAPNREAIKQAIAETLGDAYDCTRVWSAWGYGTMSEDDFVQVAEQDDRLEEIADAVIAALPCAACIHQPTDPKAP